MNFDQKTIDTYDAKAQEYVDFVASAEPTRQLREFVDALPAGGTALDLGCGPGNSAAYMRDQGLRVTALDASPKMAKLGRTKYNLEIKVGTFDDVSGTEVYDGVWASFSLLHAPRADIPRHFSSIHKALKQGGTFMVGVKTGRGEHRDKLDRQYTYFEIDELDQLLKSAGFTPTNSNTGSDLGLAGDVEPWVFVTAHA
ncbi:MAG: methyltransferase domain-containing protein [Rhodobacteraceae bacterium]|nr:methyltransferase domain-containing protein [Paracoccaceae bacterium]